MEKETISICTFQPIAVYNELMEKGIYSLNREDFLRFSKIEQRYKPCHHLEKYDRLIKKSGLILNGNMPIWGWHKENGQIVFPKLYEGALERRRKIDNDGIEFVGLFLEVPKKEVYLTNFLQWDLLLMHERWELSEDDTEDMIEEYNEEVRVEEHFFSKLEEFGEEDTVQAIFPAIKKEMITYVLREK